MLFDRISIRAGTICLFKKKYFRDWITICQTEKSSFYVKNFGGFLLSGVDMYHKLDFEVLATP